MALKYRTILAIDVDATLSEMAAAGWRLVGIQSPPLYDAQTQKNDHLRTRLFFEMLEPAPYKAKAKSHAKSAAV